MATPRLLLFGTPGAGKTSLLGALAQSAATQAALLKGQLADPAGAWERLKQNTYSNKANASPASASYDLVIKPSDQRAAPIDAVVTDTGGKDAQETLKAKKPILNMDAFILAVDASRTGKQLAEEFQQCARWLIALRKARGRRTEIGELPVFLVLTKCDLLAKQNDTFAQWLQRIEEGKRKIDERFRDFLKEQGTGFGTIQLAIFATAIRSPALTDRPAQAQEPFGVAEMFRQCLQAAADFQERRQASQSRLQNLVVGALGMVAMLALAVALLFEFQPVVRPAGLDEKLQTLLPKKDASARERLRGGIKTLEEKQKELAAIQGDADFARLPTATRAAVAKYEAELKEYLQAKQLATVLLKLPHLAKNQEEFKAMEKSVASFALPAEYARQWEETPLARQILKVRKEYAALHAELGNEAAWIRGQIAQNQALLKAGNRLYGKLLDQEKDALEEAQEWNKQYQAQMSARPPMPREDYVPGVSRILYEDLAKFEPVLTAQKDWKTSKSDATNLAALIRKKL